ncbi:diguanylate cyclase [Thiospirochaeta perfilievii]|uniref:diguanylate cyclase n=1 Tax=Thiospirochaeta perfilievii TaxID=252967 RepID=A0A5C1QA86_9SPIO|nr:GGDEF domain-containing protein [Thiospirochaeta perfilievii]QEN04397.1 diguanylate cyclase [Thiospirochaeta perfilievii]
MTIDTGIFSTETEIVNHTQEIINLSEIEHETLLEEYKHLAKSYAKILKQTKKLINLADNTQKRLKESNNLVEDKIHQLLVAEKNLKKLATTDSLTGLKNRRGISRCLENCVKRSQNENLPFTIFLMDIDHFKIVNDKYGHATGDRVLKRLSAILKSTLRSHDCIARWGGEEFLIILPETTLDSGYLVAEKIRKNIEKIEINYNNYKIKVTVSLGGCLYNNNLYIEQSIHSADEALYVSKSNGRNRVSLYEDI